jgi:hypothetical protein
MDGQRQKGPSRFILRSDPSFGWVARMTRSTDAALSPNSLDFVLFDGFLDPGDSLLRVSPKLRLPGANLLVAFGIGL